MRDEKGFTFIELMCVISIIGILAAIAIPQFNAYRNRAYMCEGYALFDNAKKNIIEFYEHTGDFPKDNNEAGLPSPEKIRGKYVESVTVSNGAVNIKFYQDFNAANDCAGKTITIRPAVLINNPTGSVIWLRGGYNDDMNVPSGFKVFGDDNTDID